MSDDQFLSQRTKDEEDECSLFAETLDLTESIDLKNLLAEDLTNSGSFDIQGERAAPFRKLLQALPMPALLVNESGRILFVNRSCRHIIPRYDAMQGRELWSFFSSAEAAAHARSLLSMVFATRKFKHLEAGLKVEGGSMWGRMHLRSIRLGSRRAILVLVEDLTLAKRQIIMQQKHQEELERRVAERTSELVKANERLKEEISHRRKAEEELRKTERTRAIAEMAGGVAHNFNNLLQLVMHGAQMACRHIQSGDLEAARSKIRRIIDTSQLGSETVRRLQDFAGVRTLSQSKTDEVLDLSQIVARAVELSRPWWKDNPQREGIDIRIHQDLGSDCQVKGREHDLFGLVINLIKNAAEALPNGGQIRVSTLRDSSHVFLRISDNGVGIAPEHIEKVFEPFWTTKGYHGLGMGLASSVGIVSDHNGEISLESAPDKGTTVTVRLPCSREKPAGKAKALSGGPGKPLRLLIIDDEQALIELLKEGLTQFGHHVLTAASGQEALAMFQPDEFDAVISDLGMPGMNGWQVAEQIKAICKSSGVPKTPFILLTGWGGLLDQENKIADCGIDKVVEKPVMLEPLLETIRTVVAPATEKASRQVAPAQESWEPVVDTGVWRQA